MNVLLFGERFGAGDVGIDAALAAVVRQVRRLSPGASVSVATDDRALASALGVAAVPSYGFSVPARRGFAAAARRFDAAVWCGGEGLSSHPDVSLDLVARSQAAGVATFVWCVGMGPSLASRSLRPSAPLGALLRLSGLVAADAERRRMRFGRRLARVLGGCRGVWVRDDASREELARCGFAEAKVAGDPLFEIASRDPDGRRFGREATARPTLALCLSRPRTGEDAEGARRFVAALAEAGVRVVGLPFAPADEVPLMASLGVAEMLGRTGDVPLPGFPGMGISSRPVPCDSGFCPETSPEAVAAFAGECDLVLADRLEPLVLAADGGTPCWGIGRDTSVAAWLANLGRATEDGADGCDWDDLAARVVARLGARGWREEFEAARDRAYCPFLTGYEFAKHEFAVALSGVRR